MVFGTIMSVLLLSSGLALILTEIGRMIPTGIKLLPFIELGLLWLYLLVVLYSAHRDLRLEFEKTVAAGFASPVYGAQIRPPLRRFIRNADLGGCRCFAVLTGGPDPGDEELAQKDLQSVIPLIEERGGRVVAAGKIPQNKEPSDIEVKIDALAGDILAAIE